MCLIFVLTFFLFMLCMMVEIAYHIVLVALPTIAVLIVVRTVYVLFIRKRG